MFTESSITHLLALLTMPPPRGRPKTPSSERHLFQVVVPRLHRDDVQDGRPVEEGHLPRFHPPPRQVAHLRGVLAPLPALHLHLCPRPRYPPHRGAWCVVGGEGLVDAS